MNRVYDPSLFVSSAGVKFVQFQPTVEVDFLEVICEVFFGKKTSPAWVNTLSIFDNWTLWTGLDVSWYAKGLESLGLNKSSNFVPEVSQWESNKQTTDKQE